MEKEIEDRIQTAVEAYLADHQHLVPLHHYINPESRAHIIQISSSIIKTRDKILSGGSFVKAICENDLFSAVNKADSINSDCIRFYATLCQHLRKY